MSHPLVLLGVVIALVIAGRALNAWQWRLAPRRGRDGRSVSFVPFGREIGIGLMLLAIVLPVDGLADPGPGGVLVLGGAGLFCLFYYGWRRLYWDESGLETRSIVGMRHTYPWETLRAVSRRSWTREVLLDFEDGRIVLVAGMLGGERLEALARSKLTAGDA